MRNNMVNLFVTCNCIEENYDGNVEKCPQYLITNLLVCLGLEGIDLNVYENAEVLQKDYEHVVSSDTYKEFLQALKEDATATDVKDGRLDKMVEYVKSNLSKFPELVEYVKRLNKCTPDELYEILNKDTTQLFQLLVSMKYKFIKSAEEAEGVANNSDDFDIKQAAMQEAEEAEEYAEFIDEALDGFEYEDSILRKFFGVVVKIVKGIFKVLLYALALVLKVLVFAVASTATIASYGVKGVKKGVKKLISLFNKESDEEIFDEFAEDFID